MGEGFGLALISGQQASSGVPPWIILFVGLTSPIAAIVAALCTTLLTARYTDKRETRRLGHEKELKEAEFEDRRRKELRDERREAYRNMADLTRTLQPREPYTFTDLSEAYFKIEFLTNSPNVLAAAWRLFDKANVARRLARDTYLAKLEHIHYGPDDDVPSEVVTRLSKEVSDDPEVASAFRDSEARRDEFRDAARQELELPPLPSLAEAFVPKPIDVSDLSSRDTKSDDAASDSPSNRPW